MNSYHISKDDNKYLKPYKKSKRMIKPEALQLFSMNSKVNDYTK